MAWTPGYNTGGRASTSNSHLPGITHYGHSNHLVRRGATPKVRNASVERTAVTHPPHLRGDAQTGAVTARSGQIESTFGSLRGSTCLPASGFTSC